jgi:hypothetical protein
MRQDLRIHSGDQEPAVAKKADRCVKELMGRVSSSATQAASGRRHRSGCGQRIHGFISMLS